mmetsp:Transcript_7811/g.19967  ORF Transcript_7811/g.19967 Transcript_7811/m.19967 type:complete len:648 (+) Transcript_7811:65-2008(+)
MKGMLQRLKPRESARESGKVASSRITPSMRVGNSFSKASRASRAPSGSLAEAEYERQIAQLREENAALKAQLARHGHANGVTLVAAPAGKGAAHALKSSASSDESSSDEVVELTGARGAAVGIDAAKEVARTNSAELRAAVKSELTKPKPKLRILDNNDLPAPPGSVNAGPPKKVVANSVGYIELSDSRRAHLAQLMAVPIDEAQAVSEDIDRAMSQPNSPREGQRLRRLRRERQRRRVILDRPPETPGATPSRKAAGSVKRTFPVPSAAPAAAEPRLRPTCIDASVPERVVKLSELVMLRPLGTGGYGAVGLARLPRTEMVFAVKAVSKAHVTTPPAGGPAAVMRIRRERDALIALQGHPCVLHLYGTHVDAGHVYLITEACMGGELLRMLKRSLLDPHDAAFYAASVVLALQAAHSRGLAHRDIKPENVLIDSAGFARLVDWGAAVFVGAPDTPGDAASGGRTLTRFGTLEYMSPEVARGKGHLGEGHTLETDWWSLGALIFEMLVGRTPCVAAAEDTDQDVLRRIARGEVIWPRQDEAKLSPTAADLLAGLLRRDETKRLGARATGGAAAVRAHPFFSTISFSAIANRSGIEPPWRPQLGSSDDNCFSPGAANPTRFVEMLNNAFAAPYDSVEWDPHFTDFASF